MIELRDGDIFEQEDIQVLMHQANCCNIMGGGIALCIKTKYPEAFKADAQFPLDREHRLGKFSYAITNDKIIVNLYGQDTPRYDSNTATDYGALRKALEGAANKFSGKIFGVPYLLGSGLAGGDWEIVKGILKDIFVEDELIICKI